jgi:hypothetical protein
MAITGIAGLLMTDRAAPDAADQFGVLRDVLPQGTYSFSRRGFAPFHVLIGAAALAAPSK